MAELHARGAAHPARAIAIVVLLVMAAVFFAVGMPSAGAENASEGATDIPSATASATSEATATESVVPSEGPSASVTPSATDEPTDDTSEDSTSSPSPSAIVTATATATATATETVTASPPATTGPVEVRDATLYWDMSNEATNKAHAPRTFNFFSAGALSNERTPQNTIAEANWRATDGNVTIQKLDRGSWRTARWADLFTDTTGAPLVSATAGRFSGIQMAFGAGIGTADARSGDARVEWSGSATVVGYSGMISFRITDPVLQVRKGTGRLTAKVVGYGTSRELGGGWTEYPAQEVTLADLPKVEMTDGRISATPAYEGVPAPAGLAAAQVRTTAGWGAFPASFVSYQERLGNGSFWYTSDGITDSFKTAKPLSVTFVGSTGSVPPAPTTSSAPEEEQDDSRDEIAPPPIRTPEPVVTIEPSETPQASSSASPSVGPSATAPAPALPTPPTPATPPAVTSAAGAVSPQLAAQPEVGGLPGAAVLTGTGVEDNAVALSGSETQPVTAWWWSAGALFLLAAALLAIPLPRATARS